MTSTFEYVYITRSTYRQELSYSTKQIGIHHTDGETCKQVTLTTQDERSLQIIQATLYMIELDRDIFL